MSKQNYQVFHVIISPQDKSKLQTQLLQFQEYLDKNCSMYIVSDEYGDSKYHTHYDAVIFTKKEKRPDNVAKALRNKLELVPGTDEYRHCVKVYGVDDLDVEWQVGYCLKEQHDFIESEIFDIDKAKCIELYLNDKQRQERRIVKNKETKHWSPDTVVDKYIEYLKENQVKHCKKHWARFRSEIKPYLKFTTFQKINKQALNEYLEAYNLDENLSILLVNDEDVLGLNTIDGLTTCSYRKKN